MSKYPIDRVALKFASVVRLDSTLVEVISHTIGIVPLFNSLVKDQTHNRRLRFIDSDIHELLTALVVFTAAYQCVPIGSHAAGIYTLGGQLSHSGRNTDGGAFAFRVGLPIPHIIQKVIDIILEPLLTLLGTPDFDTLRGKPFHHKGCFILASAQPVKHKDQQDIEFFPLGGRFQVLDGIPVIRRNLKAGNTFFKKFLDDHPAVLLREPVAGLFLHGNVIFIIAVFVDLTFSGYPI